MVLPCYNVGQYIDTFFRSLISQSVSLDNVEVIAVDDGSTDDTAQRLARWRSAYPRLIKVITQTNQGLSAARNTGMAACSKEWISFPDPDDFLDRRYLLAIDKFLQEHGAKPICLLSCHSIHFRDSEGAYADDHPLAFRYALRKTIRRVADMGDFMQLAANSSWMKLDQLRQTGLQFDSRIVPTFEDGHLINRFLVKSNGKSVAFLRTPMYYYRKRATSDSLVDRSKERREWYLDQCEHGYLALLEHTADADGRVPVFVQRTVLYDVWWKLIYLLDQPERAAALSPPDREAFFAVLTKIFSYIDFSTVEAFKLGRMYEQHKVGIKALFYASTWRPTVVYFVDTHDAARGVRAKYYSDDPVCAAVVKSAADPIAKQFPKTVAHRILDRVFFYEHSFYFTCADEPVQVIVEGAAAKFSWGGRRLSKKMTFDEIARTSRAPSPPKSLKRRHQRVRELAQRPEVAYRYKDAWIFVDHDDKAGDNAEHLYRFVSGHAPSHNIFFALRRSSRDWKRLSADGFRLIDFDSAEHRAAILNADFIISSHADHFIRSPLKPDFYGDLLKFRFVFLQHGVTKDDQSRWFNTMKVARLITATPAEFDSIVDPQSNYGLTANEVVLSGFPRHDVLLRGESRRRQLVIMPTWRRYLVGGAAGRGNVKRASERFFTSTYAKSWKELLHSPELERLAARHNLEVVFCSHPNMGLYADWFAAPAHVKVVKTQDVPTIQPYFMDAAALVTDFSSVAFDVAYLDKPVVYYQFDEDEFFRGEHVYTRGYFDYRSHGFGPVCGDVDGVLEALREAFEGQEDARYGERRRATFPYRDGGCCERVYQSILALTSVRDLQPGSTPATLPADARDRLRASG